MLLNRYDFLPKIPLAAIVVALFNYLPLQAQGPYDLVVYCSKFGPHINQKFELRVVDSANGEEIARETIAAITDTDFNFGFKNILVQGHSYYVDAYADFNQNQSYDAPPQDHAWRRMLSKVTGPQSMVYEHTTEWTDIQWPVPGVGGRPTDPGTEPGGDPVVRCDCDLNGDGALDVLDAIEWLVETRAGVDNICLDWNADGKVAISDVVKLLLDIRNQNCGSAGDN